MLGNNLIGQQNQFLIANQIGVRAGEKLSSGQQASAKKLDPETLNKHLDETNKFYTKDGNNFTSLTPEKAQAKTTREKHKDYPQRNLSPDAPDTWEKEFPSYSPVEFTHKNVIAGPAWADPADPAEALKLRPGNTFQSYEGKLQMDGDRPLNPHGRTGITGRGILGKWGPNFAADPIVTRVNPETGKLEMIAINRKDSNQWAIPGGMVDYGEGLSSTLSRELAEEALGKEGSPEKVAQMEAKFREKFEKEGNISYAGYVDDPRNTDNSWMETKAVHVHLSQSDVSEIHLSAGDDAGAVQWMEISKDNVSSLYASHSQFVKQAILNWEKQTGRKVLEDGTIS